MADNYFDAPLPRSGNAYIPPSAPDLFADLQQSAAASTPTGQKPGTIAPVPEAPNAASSASLFEDLYPKSGILRRVVGDTAVSLGKGIIGAGEAAVGLADLATGGAAGKALEGIGYRPKQTKEFLDEFYSPEQKAANQRVQEAEGFFGTAGAMLENPSTIAHTAVESVPSMLGGGAIARGLGGATKLGAVARGAIGEGAVGAGSAGEQVRQQTDDGLLTAGQTAASLASGIGTGLFTVAGGRVAQRLGVGDIDAALAGGGLQTSAKGRARRFAEGALSEGVLEELPQSAQEQAWQNVALGRPVGEGVPEAAATGLLTGAAMGGGVAAIPGRARPEGDGVQLALPAPRTPLDSTDEMRARNLQADVERANAVAEAEARTGELYRQRAEVEAQRLGIDPAAGPLSKAATEALAGGPMNPAAQQQLETQAPTRRDFEAALREQVEPQVILDESGRPKTTTSKYEIDLFHAEMDSRLAKQQRNLEAGQRLRSARSGAGQAQAEAPAAQPLTAAANAAAGQQDAPVVPSSVSDDGPAMDTQRRRAVLDAVLSDPETADPARRFTAMLEQLGYRNAAVTADELRTIQRFEDVRNAQPAAPEIEPSAPNELDPAALGIREQAPQERTLDMTPHRGVAMSRLATLRRSNPTGNYDITNEGGSWTVVERSGPVPRFGRALPAQPRLAAEKMAEELSARRRVPHVVVPHPTQVDRFSAVPASELAQARTAAQTAAPEQRPAAEQSAPQPAQRQAITPAMQEKYGLFADLVAELPPMAPTPAPDAPLGRALRLLLEATDGNGAPDGLAGKANEPLRAEIISLIRGVPAEQLSFGEKSVGALQAVLHRAAGLTEGSTRTKQSRLLDWVDEFAYQQRAARPQASRAANRPAGPRLRSARDVREAVASRFPELDEAFDRMLARGERGERGGAVVLDRADEASLASAFSSYTGRSLTEARQQLQDSLSAQKSVEANVRRGREALAKAVTEETSVHRAMFRNGLGWVDFVWGDVGRVLPSGKTRGAMGLSHILEARQRKDGMSAEESVRLLEGLVDTVARGAEIRRTTFRGTSTVTLEYADMQAVLLKRPASNAWMLSGWKLNPGATGAGYVASGATQSSPTTPQAGPAGFKESLAQPMLDDNGELQGFYDPQSGIVFLVAPNLTADTAPAVLLHEITHSQQRAAIDAQAMRLVQERDSTPMHPNARALLETVEERMRAAGVENDASEASAYIVELAVGSASREGFSAPDARFHVWVEQTFGKRIADLLRGFSAAVRRWALRLGFPVRDLAIEDLVDLAHAGVRAAARGRVATAAAGRVQASRAGGAWNPAAVPPNQPTRITLRDWFKHQLRNHRGWAMGALTRDQITDIYGKAMPEVDRFDRVVQAMDAERNRITERADALVERWRQLPAEMADRLADVMHQATLRQFDPDRSRATTTPAQAELLAQWDGLTPVAKQLYRDVRDQYRDTLSTVRDGLAHRAERAGPGGRAIADQIRLQFDDYLKQGPYFPLARFGDHILIAHRGDERMVEAFESSLARERRRQELQREGWQTKLTARRDYSASKDGAAGTFVGKVLEKVDALNMPTAQKAALMDDLNQLAISTLPDASYRKHFAHRKGTPGFSNDAMRAFASSQMHAAHHIARINHADELSFLLDGMQKDIQEARGEVDTTERQQVVNELARRLDLLMNPTTHPVTAALGQVGFVMSLGGSVASGITNLTQTPMVTFPWLGAKYGFDKAAGALTTASRDYFGGKWEKWSGFVMKDNPKLSGDERTALRELEEAGLINLTQAHDLAGAANTDHTVSRRAFAINRAMKVIGWTFHTPEVFNRQVSALAAYRLARQNGMAHAAAVDSARDALIRTHFDYSASNRARFMHGNFTRVITMFKQYSQQMTYLLWRNTHQALKGETPEVKREARRMLLGVAAMHFAAAGTLGLPLGVFGISPLLALLAMGMGDEDDPWDWETEYRNMLADTVGPDLGEAIAHGPLRLVTNVDFASRVGLGDLWMRAPNKEAEGRDLVEAWMLTLLGPVAGYAGNMGTAMQAFEEGKVGRGLESMLPKFVAAPLKATRWADEGVRSWRGDDLGVELSPTDLFGAALGFQPSRLAEMYEGRTAIKGREAKLQGRREEIINMWVSAQLAGDADGMADAYDAALRFSEFNPSMRITMDTLRRSLMTKRRNAARIENGAYLPRSREDLRDEGRFANVG